MPPVGDMLVQLLKLPEGSSAIEELRAAGVVIKRANSFEMTPVVDFVRSNWNQVWADEVSIAFTRQPVACFVALRQGEVIGFCAYECTRRNFLGPMGVKESERTKGVGRALLLASLRSMREMGYGYAIIGGVGPVEFYAKACGAVLVADSSPGVYTERITKM